ncbi:MAG: hypothetical protein U1C53_02520 [Candidatus Veblenbacteria bacterium]|nr:hypothetical protein [Candidatus Veblenbacteria bacterium]MDZ4229988.1 hypothetical protein [Candidatus Veblenbacteria bacterium]
MKITTELLAPYAGGQMEVQNSKEGYIYCGEIAAVTVEDGELHVTWAWVAKGESYPPIPKQWVKANELNYRASLWIGAVIGLGDSRLCFTLVTGDAIIFSPRGHGNNLNPAKVEGLQLAEKASG